MKKAAGFLLHTLLIFVFVLTTPAYAATRQYESSAALAIAGDTFFVVAPDQTLVGWGDNEYGLLNQDDLASASFKQRRVLMKDTKSVYGGNFCVLALGTDGTLFGWGFDVFGQLCGLSPEANDFRLKLMDDVVMAAVGSRHCVALKSDGSVWVWGSNNYGQLGLGYKDDEFHMPQMVMDHVNAIYTFSDTTFAIKDDGSLYAWGGYTDESASGVNTPNYVTSGISAVAFMKGNEYQLLTTDGKVLQYKCGSDTGELDFSKAVISSDIASGARSITNSGYISEDGSLWMWNRVEASGVLEKVMDNVSSATGRADGFMLTVTTDGKLH
ncbi:MAG: hypothetical protein VB064_05415 [Oscillospiraceae bacterium]|nr:hypothetical protein [Oscillospiraceae bacterium]